MKLILYLLLVSVSFYLLDGVVGLLLSKFNENHFDFFTINRLRSSLISSIIFIIYIFFIKAPGK